jgi:O-antigen/teichoic acid export membrane protein
MLSYIYVDFGSALNGVLSAIVTSLVFVYLLGVLFIGNRYEIHDAPVHFVRGSFIGILKESLPVLIATISLAVMTQLDLVLVNYYFPSGQAGLYAAASVLGKAVLYIPGGLIIALFPMAAADKSNGVKGMQLLYKASLVTLLSCGMLACIYFIYGDFLIKALYGADYDGAGGILALYGFAMLPLALVVVAEQYVIARGETLFSWLFIVLAPIQIATIMIWHTELWMILASIGFFGALIAICGFTIIIYKNYFQLKNLRR